MTYILDVQTMRSLIGFTAIGIVFYLIYRYMLPRISPFSLIGALLRFTASITVGLLFMALLFTSPQMHWTLDLKDWVWNIVFARATPNPFSAHVFSYLSVPLIYIGALWLTRNEYFSLAYAATCVFIHEMVWFAFTCAFAVSRGGNWPTLISSSAFAFMICCFGAVIIRIYKIRWPIIALPLLYTFAFDTLWFWANQWHITVSIFDVQGVTQYAATQYYWEIGANLFENVGWLTLVPVMLLVLYWLKPKVERLTGREFDEMPKHGWFK